MSRSPFVFNRRLPSPERLVGHVSLAPSALPYADVSVGKRFGHFFESRIEVLGGLILIAIGVKILITHLATGV